MDLKKILKLFEAPVGPGAIASTAKASGIANPNLIKPGQQIRIPMQGGGEVLQTVKKGDTLSGMISRAQQTQGAKAASAKPAIAPKPAVAGTGSVPTDTSSYTGTKTEPTNTAQPQTNPLGVTAQTNVVGSPTDTSSSTTSTAQNTTGGGFKGGGFGSLGAANQAALPADQTKAAEPASRALPITTSGGPTANNPASAAATANPDGTGSGQVSSGPTDAQGFKVQSKGFIDTAKDFLSGTNKSPAPPTAAGDQTAGGRSNADFLPGSAGGANTQLQAVPEPKIDSKPLTQTPPPTMAEEDELEEELNEMLRLSGINEKAVSRQQQKFMGMVHAMQKGEKVKGASPELKKVAKTMGKKDAKDFASTKHKGLPQKVSESIMLEAGSNLEHIVTRFKHETKNFLNGAELDEDLYNALYDYYVDNGEMPYGVAKAREGDPYQWVSDHFADELALLGHQRQFQETVIPVVDNQLSELARLAGLSEGRVDECGDMGMDQRDSMNVSTNMSSDGTKSVTISAQGDQAEALIQMLKLAGMGHMGHSQDDKPVMVVSKDDEEMMDEEYKNSPDEEYHSIDSIMHQGNDLNREKRQYADKPKLGDNPMSEEIVDEELQGLLDSVLIKADEGSIKGGDRPGDLTGTWSADPPEKGKPNVPPPVPMDPVSPAAPKAPSSSAIPKPGIKK